VTSGTSQRPQPRSLPKDSLEFMKCYIERQEERDRVEAERRE